MKKSKTYPIKAVSVKTGLSIHVIRVWEKRYQAIIPGRTETNRRVYTENDVEKLMLLAKATQNGHNIGSVATLDIEALRQLLASAVEKHISASSTTNNAHLDTVIEECLASIFDFNDLAFERNLRKAAFELSQQVLLEGVIIPLIYKIGELWHGGQIRIMHEHMATVVLKNFLSNMRDRFIIDNEAPTIIATTPLGQHHEMGALLLSIVAASDGWNVTYLGPNLPADEIAFAVEETDAKAVLLSIVYPADDQYLKNDLKRLGSLLQGKIKIIAGGRMANNYAKELKMINAARSESIDEFKEISGTLINQFV